MYWTEDRLRWYQAAAERSDFHVQIVQALIPYLKPTDELLELGCGAGYLLDALLPYVHSITGADIDPLALAFLSKRQPKANTYQLDFPRELPPPSDILVTMFFGRTDIEQEACEALYRRHHIIIRNRCSSRLNVTGHASGTRRTDQDMIDYAKSQGINFDHIELDLDFHQPLTSYEGAVNYVESYKSNQNRNDTHHYLGQHLEKTDDPVFPYLIRKSKALGIVILSKETP